MNSFWKTLPRPILMLSPMAGVTDAAFRALTKEFGADVVYTEFVSADGLHYSAQEKHERLEFVDSERPVVCQIFGSKPDFFAEAAKRIESEGFDGVDINFGCPAKKVVKSGGGVTMLRDLDRCYEIVQAACEAVKNVPISVKTRTSIERIDKDGKRLQERNTVLDLINRIKDLPVEALIVHGRTYETPFAGEPDFEMLRQAREAFDGVFLANGGIHTPEDAKNMIEKTGADGVALARGVYGKPWLFRQIKDFLRLNAYVEPDHEIISKLAFDHAERLAKLKGEQRGVREMRKHLVWYTKGWAHSKNLRRELVHVNTLSDIQSILKTASTDPRKRSSRASL